METPKFLIIVFFYLKNVLSTNQKTQSLNWSLHHRLITKAPKTVMQHSEKIWIIKDLFIVSLIKHCAFFREREMSFISSILFM